jgi:hypothetical protein
MVREEPQTPLTLFDGTDLVAVFSTEAELFSAVETFDIDSYTGVDALGSAFKIRVQHRSSSGLLDKLAGHTGRTRRSDPSATDHETGPLTTSKRRQAARRWCRWSSLHASLQDLNRPPYPSRFSRRESDQGIRSCAATPPPARSRMLRKLTNPSRSMFCFGFGELT